MQKYTLKEIEYTGESVLCIRYGCTLDWLKQMNPEKIQLKKRHKIIAAMLQLPQLLEDASQRLNQPPVKALPPKPAKQTERQLIKLIEKIKGEKVTVLPYSQIKKALKTFNHFDNLLVKAKGGSTQFLTELLGDPI